jgi:hypothetical protein
MLFPLKRPARHEKNTSNMAATVGHVQVLYTQLSLSMAALVGPLCGKRDTYIHDISNTYVPFPLLFVKGK